MRNLYREKYFYRILLLVTLAMFVLINLVSFTLYKNYETDTINKIIEMNIDILNETSRINEFIARNAKLSGMNLFYEPSVQKLMNYDKITNFEKIEGIRRIDFINSSSIHYNSIYLYNSKKEYIYSTSNEDSGNKTNFYDAGAIRLIEEIEEKYLFNPIPRWIETKKSKVPVYTFYFKDEDSGGILLINLNLSWFSDIDNISTNNEKIFYVLDKDKRIVYSTEKEKFLSDLSEEPYVQKIFSFEKESGSHIEKINGKKTLITYSKPKGQGWYFIKQMPYDSLILNIERMRFNTVLFTISFLFVGFIVSLLLSKKLSMPIERIVDLIKGIGWVKESDDISYITNSIQGIIEKTSNLETVSSIYLYELNKELMREIIIGNIRGEDIQNTMQEYNIGISYYGNYNLILCYNGNNIILDKETEDLFGALYNLRINENSLHLFGSLTDKQLKQIIDNYRELGVEYISYSNQITSIEKLNSAYEKLNDAIKNRLFFPEVRVFNIKNIDENLKNLEYPIDIESDLLSCIRKGDIDSAKITFTRFLNHMKSSNYKYFKFNLFRLFFSIKNLINDLKLLSYVENEKLLNRDYLDLYIDNADYLSEIEDYFIKIFILINNWLEEERSKKNIEIVNNVSDFINDNFKNPELNIQLISESVSLSPSYVNQIFKLEKGVTISEYLLNVRLNEAKRLLKNQEETIKEISQKVGFNNANYFYTLFKKLTGLTPGEFRKMNE